MPGCGASMADRPVFARCAGAACHRAGRKVTVSLMDAHDGFAETLSLIRTHESGGARRKKFRAAEADFKKNQADKDVTRKGWAATGTTPTNQTISRLVPAQRRSSFVVICRLRDEDRDSPAWQLHARCQEFLRPRGRVFSLRGGPQDRPGATDRPQHPRPAQWLPIRQFPGSTAMRGGADWKNESQAMQAAAQPIPERWPEKPCPTAPEERPRERRRADKGRIELLLRQSE